MGIEMGKVFRRGSYDSPSKSAANAGLWNVTCTNRPGKTTTAVSKTRGAHS
jgi:hypothetical protein